MKLANLAWNPLWLDTLVFPGWLTALTAQIEIVIAVVLVLPFSKRLKSLAFISFFGPMTCASGILVFSGFESCGCLGSIESSPWISFLFNVAVLCAWNALGLICHCTNPDGTNTLGKHRLDGWLNPGSLFGASLAIALGTFFLGTTHGHQIWKRANSNSIVVVNGGAVLLTGSPNERHTATITLNNSTGVDAKIFGGFKTCACLTLNDLPVVVPAHGSVELQVEVVYPNKPGPLSRRFVYYVDHPDQYFIIGIIQGEVTDRNGS